MKRINVELHAVKVTSFSPAKEDVSIIIMFNDGKEKEITTNLPISRGEDAAMKIIKDIRRMETRLNAEFDGKTILDNYSSVVISNEEKAIEKMKFFFSKVFEKVKIIKNQRTSEGYMNLVSEVNNLKVEF